MTYTWELFFLLSLILVIAEHPDDDLEEAQVAAIGPVRAYRRQLPLHFDQIPRAGDTFLDGAENFPALVYTYSFKCVADSLNEAIREAKPGSEFLSEVLRSMSKQAILLKFIGDDAIRALAAVTKLCTKRILITLDGFDRAFQDFRGTGYLPEQEERERRTFELAWLRGLLHFAVDVREERSRDPIYGLVDLCFTVPRDRFHEILCFERDSYRYDDKYSDLDWSGIELCIMLRKRIELIGSVRVKNLIADTHGVTQSELLDEALRRVFPEVPSHVKIEINGASFERHLFLYVLRHSFWRPRDVLIYYSRIIELCRDVARRSGDVDSASLRLSVSMTTSAIINSEFINEYSQFVHNLPEILAAFTRASSVLSFEQISLRLSSVHFEVRQESNPFESVEDKVEFLYEVGFIGVRLTEDQRRRAEARCRDVFYFTEGSSVFRPDGGNYKDFTYLIHPIFTEFLQLVVEGTELVLDPTWEDVQELDKRRVLMSSSAILCRGRRGGGRRAA